MSTDSKIEWTHHTFNAPPPPLAAGEDKCKDPRSRVGLVKAEEGTRENPLRVNVKNFGFLECGRPRE